MSFVSITRLRIRSWWFLPPFLLQTRGAIEQARHAPGFRAGSLLRDRHLTFWTMTLWREPADMRAYIASGSHLAAMPRLLHWCDEASIVHWQAGDSLPDWPEADRRMRLEGRPSKVRNPSPAHAGLAYDAPRTTTSVPITAAA